MREKVNKLKCCCISYINCCNSITTAPTMSIYIFLSTVIKVLSLLLLPALVVGQCANPMPSGACCEADGFFTEADPEVPLQGSLIKNSHSCSSQIRYLSKLSLTLVGLLVLLQLRGRNGHSQAVRAPPGGRTPSSVRRGPGLVHLQGRCRLRKPTLQRRLCLHDNNPHNTNDNYGLWAHCGLRRARRRLLPWPVQLP